MITCCRLVEFRNCIFVSTSISRMLVMLLGAVSGDDLALFVIVFVISIQIDCILVYTTVLWIIAGVGDS
jgi:hypothetical protein